MGVGEVCLLGSIWGLPNTVEAETGFVGTVDLMQLLLNGLLGGLASRAAPSRALRTSMKMQDINMYTYINIFLITCCVLLVPDLPSA